jgi:Cu-processing system permease protein
MITALRGVVVLGVATLVEAIRNRLLLVSAFFALVLILLSVAAASVSYGDRGRMIVDVGLAAASGVGSLIAVALAVTTFAAELRKRTAYTLLARPLPRWAFVFGKLAGVTLAMQLVVVSMLLATAFTVVLYGGTVPDALWACAWLNCVEIAVVSALTILFCTLAEPVLAATYSVGVVLAGNLADELMALVQRPDQPEALRDVLTGAYYVLPDLSALSARAQAANQLPTPEGLVAHGTLYGLAYALTAGLLAALVFTRRRSI